MSNCLLQVKETYFANKKHRLMPHNEKATSVIIYAEVEGKLTVGDILIDGDAKEYRIVNLLLVTRASYEENCRTLKITPLNTPIAHITTLNGCILTRKSSNEGGNNDSPMGKP